METIEIKRVTQAEVEKLQSLSKTTFLETFEAYNTQENMKTYLENNFSKEQLIQEISQPESEFYFATINNEEVGYLKLNYGQAQTEFNNPNELELQRIYVLKAYLGKAVGQVLYQKALEVAQSKKMNYLWLGVWEQNLRAIQFYKKNNFIEFDTHIFTLGNEEQRDILMKVPL